MGWWMTRKQTEEQGRTDVWDEWMDGWMDGWMDAMIDGLTDGWTGRTAD